MVVMCPKCKVPMKKLYRLIFGDYIFHCDSCDGIYKRHYKEN